MSFLMNRLEGPSKAALADHFTPHICLWIIQQTSSYCNLRFIQTSFRNTDCKYILNKHLDLSECGSSTVEEQAAEKISGTCAVFLPSYLRLLPHVNVRQLLIKDQP